MTILVLHQMGAQGFLLVRGNGAGIPYDNQHFVTSNFTDFGSDNPVDLGVGANYGSNGRVYRLLNSGTKSITIKSISSTNALDFKITGIRNNETILPNGFKDFIVYFTPSGIREDNFTSIQLLVIGATNPDLPNVSGGKLMKFNIKARSCYPRIRAFGNGQQIELNDASPSVADFTYLTNNVNGRNGLDIGLGNGNINYRTTVHQVVNSSPYPLKFDITLTGDTNFDFTIGSATAAYRRSQTNIVIPANSSIPFYFRINSNTSIGGKIARVTLLPYRATNSFFYIISGDIIAPRMDVTGGGYNFENIIRDNEALTYEYRMTHFGSVSANTSRTLRLYNQEKIFASDNRTVIGTGDNLTILRPKSIRIVGSSASEFSLGAFSLSPMNPNTYRDFQIFFKPKRNTPINTLREAWVEIYVNNYSDPYRFRITAIWNGSGVANRNYSEEESLPEKSNNNDLLFESDKIIVYPNPTQNGNFELQLPENVLESNLEIVIINELGAVVSKQSSQNKSILNCSVPNRGLFFIQIIKEGTIMASKKVIY